MMLKNLWKKSKSLFVGLLVALLVVVGFLFWVSMSDRVITEPVPKPGGGGYVETPVTLDKTPKSFWKWLTFKCSWLNPSNWNK